jgi:hypothetical protein
MASGHVSRIERPNTWLHRPMLQKREKSTCQPGAVHTLHETDMARRSRHVWYRGNSGRHLLGASISPFDPERTFSGVGPPDMN